MKTAKTVTAGPVLPTSSLVPVVLLLLSLTAGLAKVLLDPSTPTHTVLPEEVAVIFEAVATAVALLEALVMDNGKMVSTYPVQQT